MLSKDKILNFIKSQGYLLINFITFFLFDLTLRSTFSNYSIVTLYNPFTLSLVLLWCFILTFIASILPTKLKKIYLVLIGLLSLIILYGQTIYFNLFYKFFSFSDMSLMGEGAKYVDLSYFNLPMKIILFGLILFIIMILSFKLMEKESNPKINIGSSLMLVIGILLSLSGFNHYYPQPVDNTLWNAASTPNYIYESYNDTTKSLLLSGSYHYTFKNFTMTFFPMNKLKNFDLVNDINAYINQSEPQYSDNDMTGIFKDKNVMIIQLENIDEWMLTKQNMPTLYRLREEGINFVNHYSASFSTGRTFNTEYIVNTGMIPPTNGTAPSYIFNKNTYPISLANQFKNAGYIVNSYHSNGGHIYNRKDVHNAWGYEHYHNAEDMNMEDYQMDSQMINGYEKMIKDQKFMDFIITISAHGPLEPSVRACKDNLDKVKDVENIQDTTYLCGMAQAKETEIFIDSLIKKLDNDNLLEDTVLVFYADHYAYSTITAKLENQLKGTSDPNLLFHTPFFIWSSNLKPQTITKYTSTVDILPTILNLFDIKPDLRYYVGRDIFDYNDSGYVIFSDGSYLSDEIYHLGSSSESIPIHIQENIKYFNTKKERGWKILKSDYFK